MTDHDLRAGDGSLWRLRRRDGESDADYAALRRERAAQAASLRTYPLDWADFEQIAPPTPNGFLVSQIDELAAISKTIVDDETLEAVVRAWREILGAVPLPGEVMQDDVADAIEHRLQQIAEVPGGRIVLHAGDLTEKELDLLADSEIPPELRWNSDDIPPHLEDDE